MDETSPLFAQKSSSRAGKRQNVREVEDIDWFFGRPYIGEQSELTHATCSQGMECPLYQCLLLE